MEIKPFLVTYFILAVTVATLSPAIGANSGKVKGGSGSIFSWYPSHGNMCFSHTSWGQHLCRLRGSGLTCCKNKCVNLKDDKTNCGSCGTICQYNSRCCSGKCINVMSNPYHCGQCDKKCPGNVKCENYMCGYAS